jgi:hypothetical protein
MRSLLIAFVLLSGVIVNAVETNRIDLPIPSQVEADSIFVYKLPEAVAAKPLSVISSVQDIPSSVVALRQAPLLGVVITVPNTVAGKSNTVTSVSSAIGCTSNTVIVVDNAVAGRLNTASSVSTAIAGSSNTATTVGNAVAGRLNTASSVSTAIAGSSNTASSVNVVVAGNSNAVTTIGSAVSGATSIATSISTAIGGSSNAATIVDNAMAGGSDNVTIVDNAVAGNVNIAMTVANAITGSSNTVVSIDNALAGNSNSVVTIGNANGGIASTAISVSTAIASSPNAATAIDTAVEGNSNTATVVGIAVAGTVSIANSVDTAVMGSSNAVTTVANAVAGNSNTVTAISTAVTGISNTATLVANAVAGNSNTVTAVGTIAGGTVSMSRYIGGEKVPKVLSLASLIEQAIRAGVISREELGMPIGVAISEATESTAIRWITMIHQYTNAVPVVSSIPTMRIYAETIVATNQEAWNIQASNIDYAKSNGYDTVLVAYYPEDRNDDKDDLLTLITYLHQQGLKVCFAVGAHEYDYHGVGLGSASIDLALMIDIVSNCTAVSDYFMPTWRAMTPHHTDGIAYAPDFLKAIVGIAISGNPRIPVLDVFEVVGSKPPREYMIHNASALVVMKPISSYLSVDQVVQGSMFDNWRTMAYARNPSQPMPDEVPNIQIMVGPVCPPNIYSPPDEKKVNGFCKWLAGAGISSFRFHGTGDEFNDKMTLKKGHIQQ